MPTSRPSKEKHQDQVGVVIKEAGINVCNKHVVSNEEAFRVYYELRNWGFHSKPWSQASPDGQCLFSCLL